MGEQRNIVQESYERFGDGDLDAAGRFTGTNSGPLPGPDGHLSPLGRTVDLPFADFARISDHKIVEYRTYYDQVTLLGQLRLTE